MSDQDPTLEDWDLVEVMGHSQKRKPAMQDQSTPRGVTFSVHDASKFPVARKRRYSTEYREIAKLLRKGKAVKLRCPRGAVMHNFREATRAALCGHGIRVHTFVENDYLWLSRKKIR